MITGGLTRKSKAQSNIPDSSLADMASILKTKPAGEKVRFDVERNGEKKTIEVTLGRQPSP